MTRLRILDREDMNDEQGALYDQIGAEGGPRAGPYWAYIRHPSLMRLCQDLGNWFRGSSLSGRERQIAVLTVVRHWDANYPWAVQVWASLAAGVDQDTVDAINERRDPGLTDPREKMAHEMANQLTGTHRLTDETYAEAEKMFGEEDFVALVSVIGFFGMVATTANAIDATPPEDAPARLV
jgi:4-carboxymuconolactone decarboxylase